MLRPGDVVVRLSRVFYDIPCAVMCIAAEPMSDCNQVNYVLLRLYENGSFYIDTCTRNREMFNGDEASGMWVQL